MHATEIPMTLGSLIKWLLYGAGGVLGVVLVGALAIWACWELTLAF